MIDDKDFEPWLGGARWAHSPGNRKYLHVVLAVASRSRPLRLRHTGQFKGTRLGRGTAAAAALRMTGAHAGLRGRNAIVQPRIMRLGGNGLRAALIHLRYIERDGVTRDGAPAGVYSARDDRVDGRSFVKGCAADRHQFRIVASPEDGAEYDDLKPLIRRFMRRMEIDLGTSLDWVAANHADTRHPHAHIIIRGKDELGEDLVIAPDYLSYGMQERLSSLVSLDLGPQLDQTRSLALEFAAERPTSIDRALMREMDEQGVIILRGRNMEEHSLLTGRMHKLAALGLAERVPGGRWRVAEALEAELRALEHRADAVQTLARELKSAGLDRAPAEQVIHPPASNFELTGRFIAQGFADQERVSHYLVIDGIDGRSHYVESRSAAPSDVSRGAIVRLTGSAAAARQMEQPSVDMDVLSPLALAELPARDGATWLDREIVSPTIVPRDAGFGREVRSALAGRRLWLVQQGLAAQCGGGELACRGDMIQILERRELARAGAEIERETSLAFKPFGEASVTEGILRRRVDLASGRFALIGSGHEFALVPWQPEMDTALGKSVRVRGTASGISWTLARERSLEI